MTETGNEKIKVNSIKDLSDKLKISCNVPDEKKDEVGVEIEITKAQLDQLCKEVSALQSPEAQQEKIKNFYNEKKEIIKKAQEAQKVLKETRDVLSTFNLDSVKRSLELMGENEGFAPSIASELVGNLYKNKYEIVIKKDSTDNNTEKVFITNKDKKVNPGVETLEKIINGYLTDGSKKVNISYFKTGLIYQTTELDNFTKANTDTQGNKLDKGTLETKDYVELLKKKYEISGELNAPNINKIKDPKDKNFLLSYIESDFTKNDKTIEEYSKKSVELGSNLKTTVGGQGDSVIQTPTGPVTIPKEAKAGLQNIDWKAESKNFVQAPVSTSLKLAGHVVSNSGELAPFVLIGILFAGYKFLTSKIGTEKHSYAGWKILLGGLAGLGIWNATGGIKGLSLNSLLPKPKTVEELKKSVKDLKNKINNSTESLKIKADIAIQFPGIKEEGKELLKDNWHFYDKDGYALGVPEYNMDHLKQVAYIDGNSVGKNIGEDLGLEDADKPAFQAFIKKIYTEGRAKFKAKGNYNFDDLVKKGEFSLKDCIEVVYARDFNAKFDEKIQPLLTTVTPTTNETNPSKMLVTEAQGAATKKVMNNPDIQRILKAQEKVNAVETKCQGKLIIEYITLINGEQFSSLTLDKVVYTKEQKEGIFNDAINLNTDIKFDSKIIKPLLLKKVLRVYFKENYDFENYGDFTKKYPEAQNKSKTIKNFIEGMYKSDEKPASNPVTSVAPEAKK